MRLIDADELIKMLQDTIDFNMKHNTFFKSFSMQHMLYILENMKTIAPLKHGRWTFIEQISGGYYSYKCSECQHLENVEKREMLGNYCSYCGARMDGEDNAKSKHTD